MADSLLNLSGTNITVDDHDTVGLTARIIIGSAFLVTSIIGVSGNSLVIFAIFASRKLRTKTNAFVLNLSVTDLITCLLLPVNIIVLRGAKMPDKLCGFVAGVIFSCTAGSVYNLAIIAINRLLLMKYPYINRQPHRIYKKVYATQTMILWISTPWIIGLLVTVIPPLFGIGKLAVNRMHRICGAIQTHKYIELQACIQALACLPPFIVIIICYTVVYRRLKRKFQQDDQNRVTLNMIYAFIAFIVCITPYSVCLVIDSLVSTPPELILYAGALILMNSAINPILYGFRHPHFREVFKHLLTLRWSQIPAQSSTFRRLHSGYS